MPNVRFILSFTPDKNTNFLSYWLLGMQITLMIFKSQIILGVKSKVQNFVESYVSVKRIFQLKSNETPSSPQKEDSCHTSLNTGKN